MISPVNFGEGSHRNSVARSSGLNITALNNFKAADKMTVCYRYNLGSDCISFSGNLEKNLSADDFRRKHAKVYPGQSLADTLAQIINNDNYINEGKNSAAFAIPGIKKYVVKVAHPTKGKLHSLANPENKQFKQVEDDGTNINCGQTVLDNGAGISIVKRVPGKPHSLKKWVSYMENPDTIGPKEARKFLKQMRTLADFPQKSYEQYAKIILKHKNNKIDSINPNNTMIDADEKSIGIIDFSSEIVGHPNSREDMIFPLIDIFLHGFFYKQLNAEDQKELEKLTRVTIKKCNRAADKVGLASDEESFWSYILKKVQAVSSSPETRMVKFRDFYTKTMKHCRADIYPSKNNN